MPDLTGFFSSAFQRYDEMTGNDVQKSQPSEILDEIFNDS